MAPSKKNEKNVSLEKSRLNSVASMKQALELLGNGFFSHPKNEMLRRETASPLLLQKFYPQLLCLLFRLLFLICAEVEQLFFSKETDIELQQNYFRFYSPRGFAEKEEGNFSDFWTRLLTLFGQLRSTVPNTLNVPHWDSFLFANESAPLLEASEISDEVLHVVFRLLCNKEFLGLNRSSYVLHEEIGFCYEQLLEYHPHWNREPSFHFSLISVSGHRRKTSGSYYTPQELVESLLHTTLDPLLENACLTEKATSNLLSLKIADPACGTGVILKRVAHRITKHLLLLQKEPGVPSEEYQKILRQVISSCVYGVDNNPLTVEICKMLLWFEVADPKFSLSSLSLHIRCGDSLLGATPALMKRLFSQEFSFEGVRGNTLFSQKHWADICCLYLLKEVDTKMVFAMAEYEKHPLKKKENIYQKQRKKIQELSNIYHFFHWHFEFPQLFLIDNGSLSQENFGWNGGFDAIIGNPPWERIKIQEREWCARFFSEIAQEMHATKRHQHIKKLKKTNPAIYLKLFQVKQMSEKKNFFFRNNPMYALASHGDINLYPLFVALSLGLTSAQGRIGWIIPSGFATDHNTQYFFQELMQRRYLQSFYHFDNRANYFQQVGAMITFALMTLAKVSDAKEIGSEFVFFAQSSHDLQNPQKRLRFTLADFACFNPNTKNAVIFREKKDAEIIGRIYQQVPIFWNETAPEKNRWDIQCANMFHMTNDAHLFHLRKKSAGFSWLPLYEAKMFHQFNPYFFQKQGVQKQNYPRYQIKREIVQTHIQQRSSWARKWFLGVRGICRSTDERTVIASILPFSGVGNSVVLIFMESQEAALACVLLASLCSFVVDYIARVKIGGPNLNFYVLKQLPLLPPLVYLQPCVWNLEQTWQEWIQERVLQLIYTHPEMAPFAQDCGYFGEPFLLDKARRFQLQCELDAAYFHLYSIEIAEVESILQTFPIVRQKDEKKYGNFRTQKTILEYFKRGAILKK